MFTVRFHISIINITIFFTIIIIIITIIIIIIINITINIVTIVIFIIITIIVIISCAVFIIIVSIIISILSVSSLLPYHRLVFFIGLVHLSPVIHHDNIFQRAFHAAIFRDISWCQNWANYDLVSKETESRVA